MAKYMKLTALSGFILLLAAACSGYPPPAAYDPPPSDPPRYDDPPPQYDPPPGHDTTEERIHDRVHRALERSPELRDVNIAVRVEYRNVYLSGRVYSHSQKKVAHEVAHSVDGVDRVFTRGIRVY